RHGGSGARDAFAHPRAPAAARHHPHPHAGGVAQRGLPARRQASGRGTLTVTPKSRSSAAVAANGSPTTVPREPASPAPNPPPPPWIAYAPALSSGSPPATYASMAASS